MLMSWSHQNSAATTETFKRQHLSCNVVRWLGLAFHGVLFHGRMPENILVKSGFVQGLRIETSPTPQQLKISAEVGKA